MFFERRNILRKHKNEYETVTSYIHSSTDNRDEGRMMEDMEKGIETNNRTKKG